MFWQYLSIQLYLEASYQRWIGRMGYKDARWNRKAWASQFKVLQD